MIQTHFMNTAFFGDNYRENKAHAPWYWDDHNDRPHLSGGELAKHPARLVGTYFSNLGNFVLSYEKNGYSNVP